MVKKNKNAQEQECFICKQKHPFDMPKEIIEAAIKGELVIFTGAGVSTESPFVYKISLYEEVKEELNLKPDQIISFSKLMTDFCKQKDGRRNLLIKIKMRFDYISSFPELYNLSSQFHKELATIHHIKEIVTTNWDDLFEVECGAVPIVTAEDFVFWNYPGRKVLKLHGSVNNYGSIIATEEDYKKCYKKLSSNLIGGYLKTLLATKTILFVGYSFGDEDFNKIYRLLMSEMNNLAPHAYVVTINKEDEKKFDKLNITTIITDATHFIKVLKDHLISQKEMLPDKIFDGISQIHYEILLKHNQLYDIFNCKKNPEVLFTGSYQDGLLHAFERIMTRMITGEYSNEQKIFRIIMNYEQIRKQRLKMKKYHDVAYIDGYINGLYYLIANDSQRKNLPIYYLFGIKKSIKTLKEYKNLCKSASTLHKSSYNFAKKLTVSEDLVIHHTPFLL